MKVFAWKSLTYLMPDAQPGGLMVTSCCLKHARAGLRRLGRIPLACEAFFTEPDIIREANPAIEGTQPTAWIIPEDQQWFRSSEHVPYKPYVPFTPLVYSRDVYGVRSA